MIFDHLDSSSDSGLDADFASESLYPTIDLSDPTILTSLTKGELIDPTLAGLAVSAVQTGDVTPLIKEELKCTIQKRRLQSGKDEIDLEEIYESKSKREKMSPEEEDKRRLRRERNKLAAQKCRMRRKEVGDKLEGEVYQLKKANQMIEDEIEALEKEKEQLRYMLLNHDSKIQHCPQRARLSDSDFFSDTVSISDAMSDAFYENDENEAQEYMKNIPDGEQVIEIELVEDDGTFALIEGAEIVAFQS